MSAPGTRFVVSSDTTSSSDNILVARCEHSGQLGQLVSPPGGVEICVTLGSAKSGPPTECRDRIDSCFADSNVARIPVATGRIAHKSTFTVRHGQRSSHAELLSKNTSLQSVRRPDKTNLPFAHPMQPSRLIAQSKTLRKTYGVPHTNTND